MLSDPGSLETCLSLVGGGDQEEIGPAETPTVCQATMLAKADLEIKVEKPRRDCGEYSLSQIHENTSW